MLSGNRKVYVTQLVLNNLSHPAAQNNVVNTTLFPTTESQLRRLPVLFYADWGKYTILPFISGSRLDLYKLAWVGMGGITQIP